MLKNFKQSNSYQNTNLDVHFIFSSAQPLINAAQIPGDVQRRRLFLISALFTLSRASIHKKPPKQDAKGLAAERTKFLQDQRNNLATLSAYFDAWWSDEFIGWNATEYVRLAKENNSSGRRLESLHSGPVDLEAGVLSLPQVH